MCSVVLLCIHKYYPTTSLTLCSAETFSTTRQDRRFALVRFHSRVLVDRSSSPSQVPLSYNLPRDPGTLSTYPPMWRKPVHQFLSHSLNHSLSSKSQLPRTVADTQLHDIYKICHLQDGELKFVVLGHHPLHSPPISVVHVMTRFLADLAPLAVYILPQPVTVDVCLPRYTAWKSNYMSGRATRKMRRVTLNFLTFKIDRYESRLS